MHSQRARLAQLAQYVLAESLVDNRHVRDRRDGRGQQFGEEGALILRRQLPWSIGRRFGALPLSQALPMHAGHVGDGDRRPGAEVEVEEKVGAFHVEHLGADARPTARPPVPPTVGR